jgi:hypothetical protein
MDIKHKHSYKFCNKYCFSVNNWKHSDSINFEYVDFNTDYAFPILFRHWTERNVVHHKIPQLRPIISGSRFEPATSRTSPKGVSYHRQLQGGPETHSDSNDLFHLLLDRLTSVYHAGLYRIVHWAQRIMSGLSFVRGRCPNLLLNPLPQAGISDFPSEFLHLKKLPFRRSRSREYI